LQVGAIRFGTLDLYCRRPGGLRSAEVTDAAILADLATTVLLHQFDFAYRSGQDGPRPVTSYQDVNIATGMLAAQLRVSLDDAFARLRAHAYSEGRSVVDVAHDVVGRRIDLDQLSE
jgi:AmiR/NasT family two-component response regulator